MVFVAIYIFVQVVIGSSAQCHLHPMDNNLGNIGDGLHFFTGEAVFTQHGES
jgi:hypothetical protein